MIYSWNIFFYFDDDPCFQGALDESFTNKEAAIFYVESNLSEFFPFAEPPADKVKKVEIDGTIRWTFGEERVEARLNLIQ